MTRLQKKCLIAVAGAHLLAVVVVFCSGFFKPTPPQDNTPILELIPLTVSDQPNNTGVKTAQLPPPTPIVQPQPPTPQPQPQPEPPKPVEQSKPVEPVKQVEPVQPPEKPQPDAEIPIQKEKPKPPKHEVKVDTSDLKPVVRKTTTETPKNDDEAKKDEQRVLLAERKAQQAQQARIRAIENAAHAIKQNSSAAMTVEVQGDSNASRANYGSVVISRYYHAWVPPENMANDSAVVSFSVTIARDGNVISSHITSPSGDANVDNAVRRMLDRVNFIDAFPDDTPDRERTYHIDFNATRTSIQ